MSYNTRTYNVIRPNKYNREMTQTSGGLTGHTDASIQRASTEAQTIIEEVDSVKRNAFLEKLFPDALQREKARGQLSIVKQEFEYREQALAIVHRTSLEAITSICDQYLRQGKAGLHTETTNYIMEQRERFCANLDDVTERFFQKLMEKKRAARACEDEELKAHRLAMCDDELFSFSHFTQVLQKQFNDIVESSVRG